MSLRERLRERIRSHGPMTFRAWMEAALYDESESYYCRPGGRRWGRHGDYRTSPERSRLFGATFARYFAQLFQSLGSPEGFTILETGAGSGDFVLSVLDAIERQHSNLYRAMVYVIDERSEESRKNIRDHLGRHEARVRFSQLNKVGNMDAAVVFANELLDAFAVHRVTVQGGKLLELYVTVDDGGSFIWTTGTASTERLTEYFANEQVALIEGQIAEVNLEIEDWINSVARHVRSGFLVIVDYGAEAAELFSPSHRFGGTLRAFRKHEFVPDVLSDPGAYDLTSTIDWTFVRNVAARAGFSELDFSGQDRFLLKHGFLDELEAASKGARSEAERLKITTDAREMILPGGMAEHFQVLVLQRH